MAGSALGGSSSNFLSERLLRQNAELTGFVSRLTEEKSDLRNQTLRLEEELRRHRHAGAPPADAVSTAGTLESTVPADSVSTAGTLQSTAPADAVSTAGTLESTGAVLYRVLRPQTP